MREDEGRLCLLLGVQKVRKEKKHVEIRFCRRPTKSPTKSPERVTDEYLLRPSRLTLKKREREKRGSAYAFYEKYRRSAAAEGIKLVGNRKDRARLTACLANYAMHKAIAVRCRLKGEVSKATTYEEICENIYGRLPADIRW